MATRCNRFKLCTFMLITTLMTSHAGLVRPKWSLRNDPRDCKPEYKKCEFWFYVEERLTMMHGHDQVYPHKGKIYPYYEKNPESSTKNIDPDDIIQTDGFLMSRRVYVVNGSLPGPPLEVYPRQEVIVHVHNALRAEAISIHWHGLTQKGTPWMDGVGFVTQCPIDPGQTFTYVFKITNPPGTYWYHAHVGAQRTMGLYGALIIKEIEPKLKTVDKIVCISDWNHDWNSYASHLRMVYGMFVGLDKYNASHSLEGAEFSLMRYQSGLINGQGRFYDENGNHNGAPLHIFNIEKGQLIRFRVINVGTLYPFRTSVDGHKMKIIATDGKDSEPFDVESFIINPGEHYDVLVEADQPINNYWMRFKTLEIGVNHIAEAIVRYKGAPDVDPTTKRRECTKEKKCVVFNCPFKYYPEKDNIVCLGLTDVYRKSEDSVHSAPYSKGNFQEIFLNYAFPGHKWTPGSVNGKAFAQPPVPALTQLNEVGYKCEENPDCGVDKVCECSYQEHLKFGNTIQMVFLNMGQGKGWAHPIHMHGHHYEVLKVGYANQDPITGKLLYDNLDIDCGGNPNRNISFCNYASWANKSWGGDNIPGLNLKNPLLKETVMVPTGGYVVVRFKADNPGVWIVHCHIEIHNLDGMAFLLVEGEDSFPKPPPGFPKCGNYNPLSLKSISKSNINISASSLIIIAIIIFSIKISMY